MKRLLAIFLAALLIASPAQAQMGGGIYNPLGDSGGSSINLPTFLGTCSLEQYDPNFAKENETQQAETFQYWLLDCQRQAINNGATSFADLHIPACIRAIPVSYPFGLLLNNTEVFPRYVCPDSTSSSFIRDGSSGGTIGSNWTGDPTANDLTNLEEPLFIFTLGGSNVGSLSATLNRVGTDRGAGTFYGRVWKAKTLTIATGGTGFSGGETCTMANGDNVSPSEGAHFTCASASGGSCTSLTFSPARWGDSNAGQYFLPPFLQAQQWTAANGWNGSNFYHPRVFDGSGNYVTTCSGGAGLTVTPTWWPDWCDGTNGCSSSTVYDGAFCSTATTGYLYRIYMSQSGNHNDASYGPTYGFWSCAADLDFDLIQTSLARYGAIFYGADIRGNTVNTVDSWAGVKFAAGGDVDINKLIIDTPLDHYAEIDEESDLTLNMQFLNTGSSPTGSAAVLLGADSNFSSSSNEVNDLTLKINGQNSGATSPIPLISCANTRTSNVSMNIGNTKYDGTSQAYQVSPLVALGSHCEASNNFSGAIDNISGSLTAGTNLGVGMHIWDGAAKAYVSSPGIYNLTGSGAPTNGGSGTGVNKAGIGSLYTDTSAGALYIDTTAASSPTWVNLSSGGGGAATSLNNTNAFVQSPAAATWQLGAADAASPVAQTLDVQNVAGGTSNTAGANLTINGSQGTGTGAGGSVILQTAAATSTGSTQNALHPALTLAPGTANSIDGITVTPNFGGSPVTIAASGSDSQIPLAINVKGGQGISSNAAAFFFNSGSVSSPGFNVIAGTTVANGLASPSTGIVAFYTASMEAFRVDASQLIKLTAITSDATHTDASVCEDTTTHALYSGSGTLGICLGTSSARYKHDVVPMKDGLAQIEALKPVNFYYKNGYGDNGAKEQYGFLAEDMEKVLPGLVGLDKDGKPNSVDMLGAFPVMVNALQEQQEEIDELKAEIKAGK